MSPENCGVFRLMKKGAQSAIAREDWNTDGSPIMHPITVFTFDCVRSTMCGDYCKRSATVFSQKY
jgi:hypothetical protein